MATVKVNVDLSQLKKQFQQILDVVSDTESYLRPVAVELAGLMATRIHEDGLASDGSTIGQYESNYLRRREQNKLGSDSNVILVFTRKLSNSWAVVPTDVGWAVGFTDDGATGGVTSRQKIEYAEEHFGKKILDLTAAETEYVETRLLELINDLLSPYANPQ